MDRLARIAGVACVLVATAAMFAGCPFRPASFTIKVVNNSSDAYIVDVSLARGTTPNYSLASANLLAGDVNPANEDEFSVLLSTTNMADANSIGYTIASTQGVVLAAGANSANGFEDDILYTLTASGSATAGITVDLTRESE